MLLVPVCEMIRPPQEGEAGAEQIRLVCWGPLIRGAALQFPPYQGESFGEPPGDVKTVEDMASVGQILGDGLGDRSGIRRKRLSPPGGTSPVPDP